MAAHSVWRYLRLFRRWITTGIELAATPQSIHGAPNPKASRVGMALVGRLRSGFTRASVIADKVRFSIGQKPVSADPSATLAGPEIGG